ncbi:hypothetical protein Bbelb_428940 [Branchiostoma belcheri]|nr:hypothetical protein Bbelb_428940 [Branchiostoma belcheri]
MDGINTCVQEFSIPGTADPPSASARASIKAFASASRHGLMDWRLAAGSVAIFQTSMPYRQIIIPTSPLIITVSPFHTFNSTPPPGPQRSVSDSLYSSIAMSKHRRLLEVKGTTDKN